jgi:MORN repeat variant
MITRVQSSVFFFIWIMILAASCDQVSKNRLKTSISDKDSVKNGVVRSLFENRKIRAEINYKNGKKQGLAREYYKEGGLALEIYYEDDIKNGTAKRYHKNGNLYQSTDYKRGKLDGKQTKFRENGSAASEAFYRQDEPCKGLIEYTLDGSQKKKYPSIIITPIDNLLRDNKYTLRVSMSDKSKAVEFYTGDLTEDGCLGESSQKVWGKVTNGSIDIEYHLPPGGFMMERINIIAKVKTVQGNYFVTQKAYNVAAENK